MPWIMGPLLHIVVDAVYTHIIGNICFELTKVLMSLVTIFRGKMYRIKKLPHLKCFFWASKTTKNIKCLGLCQKSVPMVIKCTLAIHAFGVYY